MPAGERSVEPQQVRVLCDQGVAGLQAPRAPAGFSGAVPADRADSPIRAAQWLFSPDALGGLDRQPDQIREIGLLEAFGRSLVSSRFHLFEATFGQAEHLTRRYALVERDLGRAFLVRSCEDYNALASSLDRGPRSKPDILATARTYLFMTGNLVQADLVIDRGAGASAEEMQALRAWFAARPGLELSEASFARQADRASIRFWSWNRYSGLLRRHVLELDPQGRLVRHVEERFGERIGRLTKV